MLIPPLRPDGLRQTLNRDLTSEEVLWHFRSAFNVAALNCQDAEYFRMTDDYNLFLATHKRALDRANKAIEAQFRSEYGRDSARIRDTHSTQVYNFFSLPPVKSDFCDAALALGLESTITPSDQIDLFAARALPQLEGVFDRFFAAYEQYNRDLAEWMVLYGSNNSQSSALYSTQPASPTASDSYSSPAILDYGVPAQTTATDPYGQSATVPEYSNPLQSPATQPYGPATPSQLPPSATGTSLPAGSVPENTQVPPGG